MNKIFTNIYYSLRYKLRNFKPFLISAMGRSGIWYNREFFFFYNKILSGEDPKSIIENMVKEKFKIKYFINLNVNEFGYDSVFIQHFLCPGFENKYFGNFKEEWNNLIFYSKHIPPEYTEIMLKKDIDKKVNPYINPYSKIIYYYRNPLDQFVSYYNAIQTAIDDELKYYYNYETKKKEKFLDIHDFIRKAGVDMYIKHYLSFKLSQKIFPNNILILTYEDMVRNPQDNFTKVLNFIGHNINKKAFSEALKMSSKDSIVKLENAYDGPISKAYKYNTDRQLKNAKIGKWQNELNSFDLEHIKERFTEFKIDLDTFTLK